MKHRNSYVFMTNVTNEQYLFVCTGNKEIEEFTFIIFVILLRFKATNE